MLNVWIKKKIKPLIVKPTQNTSAEAKQLKIQDLRMRYQAAGKLGDMMALRKSLALCHHCAKFKMPRNWQKRFDYEELTRFHAEGLCDWCDEEKSISVFLAGEQAYWQSHMKGNKIVAETRKRERVLQQTGKYVVNV